MFSVVEILLPPIQGLKLEGVVTLASTLLVRVKSTVEQADCPLCYTPSRKIHSYYTRSLKDLAWADFSLRLQLRVCRFYCPAEECPKLTFAERLGQAVPSYARRTTRLTHRLQPLALALGGEAGAKLAASWGVKVSPDMLLQLIAKIELPATETPQVLGVDDFAWRKGQRYGTILLIANSKTTEPMR